MDAAARRGVGSKAGGWAEREILAWSLCHDADGKGERVEDINSSAQAAREARGLCGSSNMNAGTLSGQVWSSSGVGERASGPRKPSQALASLTSLSGACCCSWSSAPGQH